MTTTREGIEIFVVNNADNKMSVTKMPGLGDLVECFLQFGGLARTWFAGTHQQRENSPLKGWNEQNQACCEVTEQHFPQNDTRDPGDWKPKNGDG
ncbi:unannotated protein [freshwater metagenome]|uniref:Unannotated protein n=1 Tax=freshwater metagenome TaxID=449393 RepID=A0A6J6ZW83_9ZZZZ